MVCPSHVTALVVVLSSIPLGTYAHVCITQKCPNLCVSHCHSFIQQLPAYGGYKVWGMTSGAKGLFGAGGNDGPGGVESKDEEKRRLKKERQAARQEKFVYRGGGGR